MASPKLTAEQLGEFEAEYRAGGNIEALAEKYGISKATAYRHVKKGGWTRSATRRVRDERQSALSAGDGEIDLFNGETGEACGAPAEGDGPSCARARESERTSARLSAQDAAVRAAATAQVAIVRRHRQTLGRLNGIVETLARRMEAMLSDPEAARVPMGPKDTIGGLLESLTRALAKTIPLERQAFGIDADEEERGNGVEERVRRYLEEREERTQQEARDRIKAAGPKVAKIEDRIAAKRAANG